jgi:hypothetical protein
MPSPRRPNLRLPPQEDAATYEVGYGKPPKQTQFQAGRSGHPEGRPKGARNKARPSDERLRAIIREEAFLLGFLLAGDQLVAAASHDDVEDVTAAA